MLDVMSRCPSNHPCLRSYLYSCHPRCSESRLRGCWYHGRCVESNVLSYDLDTDHLRRVVRRRLPVIRLRRFHPGGRSLRSVHRHRHDGPILLACSLHWRRRCCHRSTLRVVVHGPRAEATRVKREERLMGAKGAASRKVRRLNDQMDPSNACKYDVLLERRGRGYVLISKSCRARPFSSQPQAVR